MDRLYKVCCLGAVLAACGDSTTAPVQQQDALVFRSDVQAVTSVAEALPGVFIPPYLDCRPPRPGDTASRPDGKVCTPVAISGCTEPGKYFPAYASCEVVRRQRPYWPAKPAAEPPSSDARLQDSRYMAELGWVTEQIAASGCTCCHDNRQVPAAQWDIARGPLWIDTLSNTGLALFAGLADSSVLGAYPAADNHGFDRMATGIPSTDSARMKAFMVAELNRRGLSEQWARDVPPFGGPIYTNSVKPPVPCGAGEGVNPDGNVQWQGGSARYVYLLTPGSKNPGVPPNLDLPQGTLWRLDVLPSAAAIESGARFGTTPPGTYQAFPERTPAEPLQKGRTYQLVVLRDMGLPVTNCLFEFGSTVPAASDAGAGSDTAANDAGFSDASVYDPPDAGGADGSSSPAMCTLTGGDAKGFGAPCSDTTKHSDCTCAANYCSKSPFDAQGYCSVAGCKENPSICPTGWSCLDISMFAPGQPSVCVKP